jgi:pimeloyl-ACP methyl ester carboxylesterase
MKAKLVFFLLFAAAMCPAQNGAVLHRQVIHFSLPGDQDVIDFVVVDTVLTAKKPVFLWCQGSLPVPLFGEIEQYGYYFLGGGIANFDYKSIVGKYHLVVISMPKTPVSATKNQINQSFQFIPNPDKPREFSAEYVKADYLDNYVERAKQVLQFLQRQPWVDGARLVVAGHSQGSKVATKIAATFPGVTHLGLFAANPFGRVDQFVREARLDARAGRISWQKADSLMEDYYRLYENAHHPDSVRQHPEYLALRTFSETFYDDWLQLSIPIYMAYGTEDATSDLCDIIPLFFIEKGKNNLTLKRYPGLEHNFFEINDQGRPVYEKAHWPEVMDAFLQWLK